MAPVILMNIQALVTIMVVMVMNVVVLLARIGELSLRGTFVPFRALDLQGLITIGT